MSALFWPIVVGGFLFALILWACLRRMNALDRRSSKPRVRLHNDGMASTRSGLNLEQFLHVRQIVEANRDDRRVDEREVWP